MRVIQKAGAYLNYRHQPKEPFLEWRALMTHVEERRAPSSNYPAACFIRGKAIRRPSPCVDFFGTMDSARCQHRWLSSFRRRSITIGSDATVPKQWRQIESNVPLLFAR